MSDAELPSAESGETATSDVAVVADAEDIAGFTRRGPGSIDSLRFKWTIRREDAGYFVDETIGDSQSAVSRGPMAREIALDFVEARHRDATARFEHRRERLASAPVRPPRPPKPPPLAPADPAPKAEIGSAIQKGGLAQELLAGAAESTGGKGEQDGSKPVNLEDVMDRITRLLDER